MHPLRSVLAAALLAGLSLGASAAALTVSFDNPIFGLTSDNPRSDGINLTYIRGGSPRSIGTNAGRFTGVASHPENFDLRLLVDLDPGSPVRFAMYCYDLDQGISAGNVVRYSVDFDGESQRTRDFLGAVNAELNKGKVGDAVDPYAWLKPGSALAGAAIQIGIWESLYDTNSAWNVDGSALATRGSFYASNLDVVTRGWLTSFFSRMNSNDFSAVAAESVIVLRSGTKQDMITGDPPTDIPLPGTLALVGLGGAAWMLRRRRH